jgi:sensor domain CHASE-containing protein
MITISILAAVAVCVVAAIICEEHRLQREHEEAIRQRAKWRLRSLCRR